MLLLHNVNNTLKLQLIHQMAPKYKVAYGVNYIKISQLFTFPNNSTLQHLQNTSHTNEPLWWKVKIQIKDWKYIFVWKADNIKSVQKRQKLLEIISSSYAANIRPLFSSWKLKWLLNSRRKDSAKRVQWKWRFCWKDRQIWFPHCALKLKKNI